MLTTPQKIVLNLFVTTSVVLALTTACSPPVDHEVTERPTSHWQKESSLGLYTIRIAPRAERIPIGEFHEWVIAVRDVHDQPVSVAQITVTGGMPSHGHGLPTQPQVTDYLGDGNFRIEGMRFNMAGSWVLIFNVNSDTGRDQVQFEIELSF